jgi:hypothetical protein
VELPDTKELLSDGETPVKRKYLYIYGGFSFSCTTACSDTWSYEISWAPLYYYPGGGTASESSVDTGNFWKL